VAQTQKSAWNDHDALARTDYGTPAAMPTFTRQPRPALPPGWRAHVEPVAEKVLDHLEPLVKRVKALPRNVVMSAAVAVPCLFLGILIVTCASRHPSDAAASEGTDAASPVRSVATAATARALQAPADKVRTARAQGASALEVLAAQYPEDSNVAKQLVLTFADAGRSSDMLRAVRGLARIDKGSVDDSVLELVVAAAQRPETSDEAFLLLEGPLGAAGVDALVELSTNKAVSSSARARAARVVARPEIRALASPGTAILLDLKASSTCTAKHDVIERAKDDGDARALPVLKSMKSPRGCGFMGIRDCWPCLRRDDVLDDAIRAVEARSPH
jgi:serine/threonine-protein kinase